MKNPIANRTAFFAPEVDIKDEKDRIIVRADVPGMKKEDLTVTVRDGYLTVEGHRKEERETKEKGYHCSERFEGSFLNSFRLPEGVKSEGVKADYKDGVLEIALPKQQGAKLAKEASIQIR